MAAVRAIRAQAAHANEMATRCATGRHTNPSTYTIAASAKGKLSSQNRINPREPRGELTCFRGLVCIAVVQILKLSGPWVLLTGTSKQAGVSRRSGLGGDANDNAVDYSTSPDRAA